MSKKLKKNYKNEIIKAFMNYSLTIDHYPKSVFKFCQDNDLDEKIFYKFFGSLEAVKKTIWVFFYQNTIDLIEKDKSYFNSKPKDKLLLFYYTFFEVLILNRSYVLFTLDNNEKMLIKMRQLSKFKNNFKIFATELVEDGNVEKPSYLQNSPKLFSEAAWLQLLFLIKFWIDDSSAEFEKTDQAIEKSVRTAFDVFDNTSLESIIDLGKFIWKEKISVS